MNQGDQRRSGAAADNGERMDERDALDDRAVEPAQADTNRPADDQVAGDAGSPDSTDGGTPALESPASAESPDPPMPVESPTRPAVGDAIGSYAVLRVLRSAPDETVYLVAERRTDGERDNGGDEPQGSARRFRLFEREPGAFSGVQSIVQALLRHPRLLAPREIFEQDGKEYLAVEALVSPDGTEAVPVAEGARLEATATLAAGAGLADALSYLHRNGIAHLHVSPDVILVLHGRAYLDGMETAERIAESVTDMAVLYARDANFLARSLAILAGVPAEPRPLESPAEGLIRQVAALGASGSFANPDEVASICASGLQTSPSLSLEAREAQARLSYHYGSATTVGRVRSENQDASASVVFDIFDDVSSDMPFCVFLVADGMGGEARGEVASRIAARAVTAEIARQFALPTLIRPVDSATGEDSGVHAMGAGLHGPHQALQRAVEEANRRVRLLAGYLGQTTGTTLTVLAAQGGQATLAHLGDSRAYLLRGDTMATMTEDHSVLARLQAIDHPLLSDPDVFVPRNMLYRSLGQEEDPNPDMVDFTLADGDRILLCSDGLWDELDDQTLAEALASAADPRECADRLVAMANDAGGNDNSTALVVFVREVPDADQPPGASAAGESERETAGDEQSDQVGSEALDVQVIPGEPTDGAGDGVNPGDVQPAAEH